MELHGIQIYINNTLEASKSYTDMQETKTITITGKTANTEYTCYAIVTDGAGNKTITNIVNVTLKKVYCWAKYDIVEGEKKYYYDGTDTIEIQSATGTTYYSNVTKYEEGYVIVDESTEKTKVYGNIGIGEFFGEGQYVFELTDKTVRYDRYYDIYYCILKVNRYKLIQSIEKGPNYIEDVFSEDRNAYPDDGTKGGYWYVFKGERLKVEPPDITGFNPYVTYYVTYDSEGTEQRTPITQAAPIDWYNYTEQKWANIVVSNNNKEAYFVWIPRYMYTLDTSTETVNVKFVDLNNNEKGTNITLNGTDYKLSEAFTWGDSESNLTQLSGYWISKYKLGDYYQSKKAGSSTIKTAVNWATGIRQMESNGQIMGLTETIDTTTRLATSSSNNIDVHLQKNTEYGTAILLGASQYGKQGNSIEERLMNVGETTGTGIQASTTGNKYGIYEMGDVSSSYEWTAGGGDGFLSSISPRYINRYSSPIEKTGDATISTANWHKSTGNTFIYGNFGFVRGNEGVFSYGGTGHYDTGFASARACVVVGEGI